LTIATESCWNKQVNIHDLRFTSKINRDLDKYKSKTCQTVILAKEQRVTSGDIIFWYIADPSTTNNAKSYSSNAADAYINGYKKWLWNKIELLLLNTITFLMMNLEYLN
jgi:hypothetical protein